MQDITQALRRSRRVDILHRILGAFIVFIPVILVCIIYVYPFFLSFASSLQYKGEISLGNYTYAVTMYGRDIIYTVYVSLASLLCVMAISITVGGYLTIHTNRIIEFFFKIPLFIPFVVVGHAMRTFLAREVIRK